MSPEVIDLEHLECSDLLTYGMAFFLIATYGDGEPTDNAMALDEWLTENC